ncbi:MAG TPA: D-aminoacylase [Candidatus Acidoferrales bacterium]|nr:D-aminoacylase [Candidatus Acidoferrales bacterium]
MRFFGSRKPILFGTLGLLAAALACQQSSSRPAQPPPAPAPQYDLLIVNGHIIDGTGSPWYKGSVAIKDGKIAAIGRLRRPSAKRTIDAHGLVVAPGFIDLHSHSDYTLLADGNAQSKIRQGVTTEIIGESASAGPVEGPAAAPLERSLGQMGLKLDWTTLGQYFSRLQKHGISVNIASYVGSGQVWDDVIGNVDRRPTPAEMDKMKELVDQAMRDGAIGLSSALIYVPNRYLTTDDLVELARGAAPYGGIYTSHIRGEGATVLQAVGEAIEIGRRAGIPTHILHMKVAGKLNWGKMKQVVALVDQARSQGVDVTGDVYPYVASSTTLQVCFPPKFLEGTSAQVVTRLRDPKVRAEIKRELAPGAPYWVGSHVLDSGGWQGVMVASVHDPADKPYEGKRMDEVARMMREDPVDALCDLLIREGGNAGGIYFMMDESDVEGALRQPWVGVGSDGSAVNPQMPFAGHPHPRYYGTFPRVLGVYVRQRKIIALPEAIRKMTALAAQITGLTDRGVLRPGLAADLVILDPETVIDQATFADPQQYPLGIPYVVVNGVVVVDNGKHTGAHPGRVLYGRGHAS